MCAVTNSVLMGLLMLDVTFVVIGGLIIVTGGFLGLAKFSNRFWR